MTRSTHNPTLHLAASAAALLAAVAAAPSLASAQGNPDQTVLSMAAGETGATNCAIVSDSSVRCWGSNQRGIVSDAPAGAFTKVSVNRVNACALDVAGGVHCWGRDLAGIVSDAPAGVFVDIDHVRDLACAVNAAGGATCWGRTNRPAASVPSALTLTSIAITDRHGCGITAAGEVACWGNDGKRVVSRAPLDAGFAQVDVGEAHACALTDTGQIDCWGRNNRGSVARAPTSGTFTQISVGRHKACAVDMMGAIECWGRKRGIGDVPVEMGFAEVSVGNRNTCAVAADGSFQCFGADTAGIGDTSHRLLFGTFNRVLRTAAVHGYAGGAGCVIDHNNSISCWDERGALANPPAGEFAALDGHRLQACAIGVDGALACWGVESNGSKVITDQPTAGVWSQVSVALRHACALDAAGQIDCWGADQYGNVNNAPQTGVFAGVATAGAVACATRADDGDITCWGDPLDPVYTDAPTGPGWGAIAMDEMFGRAQDACAIKESAGGTITCWGNTPEVSTDRPTNPGWVKVQAARRIACGLHSDGTIACWGRESAGTDRTITDVPAGAFADLSLARTGGACAIDTASRLHCWGDHMHLEPWEIETAKPLPTIVDAVFPEQGAHDVPINAPLILSLNVPIAVNDYTSNVELHREDGTLVESVHLARRNVVDAETVIVEFALQLEANTSYYVVILRKAVALQGAPYGYIGDYGDPPGDQTDPQMWRFTTGTEVDPALDGLIPEAPLPTIVDSVLPADDEVNVATNTPLMMNLNARVGVDAYTSHIAIHLAATGEEVERVRLEPIDMLDNQTMGVILSQELEPFTDYYVTIDRKALRVDDAPYGIIGNYAASFDGNSLEPDMWNFTTGEGRDPALDSPFGEADLPQVVEAVEPMDNAIDVQLDAVLFLHMNVGVIVNEYTTGISLHRLEDGALIEQFTFGPADQLDATTIMVTPSALLDPDTEYYVTIDRKATLINEAPYGYIGDYTSYVDGNSIHPTMWNFRTTSGL